MGSPYSFVGLGTNYQNGDIRTHSMGNVGIATRHAYSLNMTNPAGLSGIDSLSFVGTIGVTLDNTSYRTSASTSQYSSASINHLAVGFPITKWWKTALYLTPFSHVNYQAYDNGSLAHAGNQKYDYEGNGGVNTINWGQAFSLNKQLAIGFTASYNFGNIKHTQLLSFPDSSFIFSTQVQQEIQLSGLSWEMGAQYYLPLSQKNTLGIGVKYGLSSTWHADEMYSALRFLGSSPFNNSTTDTISSWQKNQSDLNLPHVLGVGLSWQYSDKLLVASDFIYEDWSHYKYLNSAQYVSDRWRAAIGAELVPESNTLSSYWKMIHYRLGFRYEKLGIKIAGTELNEVAISGGFGLPLRRSNTYINLGFEIGQNGTINNHLIQNRFFKISLGVTIKERWFIKNKYF